MFSKLKFSCSCLGNDHPNNNIFDTFIEKDTDFTTENILNDVLGCDKSPSRQTEFETAQFPSKYLKKSEFNIGSTLNNSGRVESGIGKIEGLNEHLSVIHSKSLPQNIGNE